MKLDDDALSRIPPWLLTYPLDFIRCRLGHPWELVDERLVAPSVRAEFVECGRCQMERCRTVNLLTGQTYLDYANRPEGYSIHEIPDAEWPPSPSELRLALLYRTGRRVKKASADQFERWERLFERAQADVEGLL